MKILKENTILSKLNEALDETTKEEYASYLYNDANGEVSDIPSFETTNDYFFSCDKKEYKEIYNMVKTAIENVADNLYSFDRGEEKIELSDRSTLNNLSGNVEDVDPEQSLFTYEKLRDEAFEKFEEETGVEIWQSGRSGRHIVVDDNFYNAYHYNELCEAQEKWEDWVLSEFEKAYPFNESLKESSYANNKLLEAVKDYGIVSVNLDEGNQTITFRVPEATKENDGYVCATVDFIEIVEGALRDMGMDVDVFGEGESAKDFGTFTLTYEPKLKGTFKEALASNSGQKSISKNIKVMNYKGTYIVLYHGHNEKEFKDEDSAFDYARKLAKEKKEKIEEAVTESEPELAVDTNTVNNKTGKIRDYLNYELEDDDTEVGGVSFNGETVADFIGDTDMSEDDDIDTLNKALVSCGIRPIAEGYADRNYRGNDYWELNDEYERGNLSDRELYSELLKLFDNESSARVAYKEITDGKEIPNYKKGFEDIIEVSPEEISQIVMEWQNNVDSIARKRFMAQDGDKYIVIDNRTGNCWTEEFNNKGSAIDYLEDRIEADGTVNESLKESVSDIKLALDKVKNDIDSHLASYDLDNNELTLTYEIPMSVGSTNRVIELSGNTIQDLVSSIRKSAKELADDFYGSLTDENDFYGYNSKEELDDRISDEEAILNNIASKIEKSSLNENIVNNNVDRMCNFIGDLFINMSEDFKSNSESLYDWCEGGDTFRNAGYSEEDCKILDKMLGEINPLVQSINGILYNYVGEDIKED